MNKPVATTKMSSKGQIVLPKVVRDAHGWREGTEFEIVDEEGKVVLTAKPNTAQSGKKLSYDEFKALLPRYDGPPITEKMIKQAIVDEAKRRWRAKGN